MPASPIPRANAAPQAAAWLRYYEYNTSFLNVTVNTGTGNGQIQLQNDADFYMTQIKAAVFDHTAGTIIDEALVTLQITDGGSNFPLFFAPEAISLVSGSAQLPYILPVPYRFRKASTVVFAVADIRAVGGHNSDIYITLAGYKKFQPGTQPGQ